MLLSDRQIIREVRRGRLKIQPFDKGRLNPAGYDLSCGDHLELPPLSRSLVATMERIELPLDLAATMHIRSTFAREGLFASLALVDPGFKGQLTIGLFNSDPQETIKIEKGEPFIQIAFIHLKSRPSKGYKGLYQNSIGIVESKRRREAHLN